MKTKKRIEVLKLRGAKFLGLSDDKVASLVPEEVVKRDDLYQPKDNMQQLIFAPDPVLGVPQSDMALILSKDTAPEVATYIRDNFMQQNGDCARLADSGDALTLGKRRNESIVAYGDRLQSIIINSYNSEFNKDKSE